MKEKITVIHHSADFDGLFCREIARKFLPDAELIGWDFADKPLEIPSEGKIYIMDLPVDRVFGLTFGGEGHLPWLERVVWIDHHKSSIDASNPSITGYRIDGVAACRLAWQWFANNIDPNRQTKEEFTNRTVSEPLAVRLVGEYDIWDKRDPRAETFQFGLRSRDLSKKDWSAMLYEDHTLFALDLVQDGKMLKSYQQRNDAGMMHRSFIANFEGLKFLALTTARCNSLTFASKDVPETGHDALMGFYFDGKAWSISLYHAKHNTGIDLSAIAVKYGGGGHRGACGFRLQTLPDYITGTDTHH